MLNFHGNGSETPAFLAAFSPSPFSFYFSATSATPPLPTRNRMSARFIPLSPLLPRRHHFFRSLDEFSFARLPACVVSSAKKAVFGDHFQVETEQCVNVFFIDNRPRAAR